MKRSSGIWAVRWSPGRAVLLGVALQFSVDYLAGSLQYTNLLTLRYSVGPMNTVEFILDQMLPLPVLFGALALIHNWMIEGRAPAPSPETDEDDLLRRLLKTPPKRPGAGRKKKPGPATRNWKSK